MNLTIGITTFERRLNIVKELIKRIRDIESNIPIILTINGEIDEGLNEQYRKDILKYCSELNYIYPIVFTTFRSLAKAWNSIIIHSDTDYVMIINDDVKIETDRIFKRIENVLKTIKCELMTINNSFSHFIISKQGAINLNWFDERFLTIGEEDGDMVWRYIKKYGNNVPNIDIIGIYNTAEGYNIPVKNTTSFIYNKPQFNRNMMLKKYVPTEENYPKGMFDTNMKQVLHDESQYPYEQFYLNNKQYLKTGDINI